MSLINDALKRAKDTQPKSPAAAAGPSLRPVELARRSSGGSDFLMPTLVVVILVLAGLLLCQWFRGGSGEVRVRAKSNPTAEAIQPAPTPAPHAAATPEKNISANANGAAVVASATNLVAAAPKPAPITYKLQSIFYWSRNPSAMINGKTVVVGGLLGDAHVVAITRDSATIVTAAGQTNLLELP